MRFNARGGKYIYSYTVIYLYLIYYMLCLHCLCFNILYVMFIFYLLLDIIFVLCFTLKIGAEYKVELAKTLVLKRSSSGLT